MMCTRGQRLTRHNVTPVSCIDIFFFLFLNFKCPLANYKYSFPKYLNNAYLRVPSYPTGLQRFSRVRGTTTTTTTIIITTIITITTITTITSVVRERTDTFVDDRCTFRALLLYVVFFFIPLPRIVRHVLFAGARGRVLSNRTPPSLVLGRIRRRAVSNSGNAAVWPRRVHRYPLARIRI